MVILTCPICFGCGILLCVALLAGSTGILPDPSVVIVEGELPSIVSYFMSLFTASVGMLGKMVTVWHWTSPFCLLCLYLFFSIATRMTISHCELLGIMSGIVIVVLVLLVLNLIPGVGMLLTKCTVHVAPYIFVLHAILLFAVLLNIVFCLILKCLAKVCGKSRKLGGTVPV